MPRLWAVLSLEQGKSRQMQPQGFGENGCPGQREDVRQEKHIISTRLQKEGSVSESLKMRACQKLGHIYNSPVSTSRKRRPSFLHKKSKQGSDSSKPPQGSQWWTSQENQPAAGTPVSGPLLDPDLQSRLWQEEASPITSKAAQPAPVPRF